MNLEKMLTAQAELDKHIVEKKGLHGVVLVPNTFLALQVELAEFANEGRWFKHWSDNQKPRIEAYVECFACNGTGDLNYEMVQEDAEGNGDHEYIDCPDCDCSGFSGTKNPLLEEFADGVHFFLSIAYQKGWQDALYIYEEQLDPDEFDGDLTSYYLEMTYFINKSHFENPSKEKDDKFKDTFGFPQKQYWFRTSWILFLNIGINGFGFTPEQIEEAYFSKHKVNYERQENGY
ncbi:dUTP diphosphatase [Heyndrickxia sp. NPDC080065]|uniref:dUTP diphosphatase n=1 Tax=Heyndrickxia sp. NPDC080065 TaxID=3390568 RepID=UPI003D057B1E